MPAFCWSYGDPENDNTCPRNTLCSTISRRTSAMNRGTRSSSAHTTSKPAG